MTRQTVVLPSSGKAVDVEVGEDGYVPPGFLARWLRRRGSPCNDYDQKADVVLPVRITPRQAAAWMADPDAYDIEGVDVRGKPLRNVGDRKGESRRIHEHIIVYGLPGEEARIRREFDEAFPSLEEQRKMIAKGDLVLEARPLKDDVSGTHSGDLIQLDRDYGIRNGVVVHEGVHHLRAVDGDRKGAATVLSPDSIPYTGKSTNPSAISNAKRREAVCVEESCTVAEQMARQRDFDPSGYYAHVQVYDPKTHRYRSPTAAEARRMAEEDRKLFTNGTGKPLSGKDAIKSVNENWARSHISRLKLGNRMAISTMQNATGTKPKGDRPKTDKPRKPRASAPRQRSSKGRPKGTRQTTLFSRSGKRRRRRWRSAWPGGSASSSTGRSWRPGAGASPAIPGGTGRRRMVPGRSLEIIVGSVGGEGSHR